jgi:hypothetical protein
MKHKLTADDVVGEIEFELAHSSLSHDELAQGIEEVRQYQNSIRAKLLADPASIDPAELARRQFQLNDMLLAALHQTALNLRGAQLEQRQLAAWVRGHAASEPAGVYDDAAVRPAGQSGLDFTARASTSAAPIDETLLVEIDKILRSPGLHVQSEVRPINVPLIGGVLTRLRAGLHNIAVFYVNRLGAQQSATNQALSEAVIRLARESQEMRRQVEALERDGS